MLDHLTKNQIELYGEQKLSSKELLSVSDHLGECESCRNQVERVLVGDASFFTLQSEILGDTAPVATHLSIEQIADYVDEIPTGQELQLVRDHLTICEQCDIAVDDLRAFKSQIAPTLKREYHPASSRSISANWKDRLLGLMPSPFLASPFAWSSALAVLLLMVTGWLVWQARQKNENTPEVATATPAPIASPSVAPSVFPIPGPSPEGPTAPLVAQLNDGGTTVALDSNGKLSGIDNLPDSYQQMVKEALSNQRLANSSLLAGLNRPGSSLMGSDEQGKSFSLTKPVGKVVISDRPNFGWSQLDAADGYVVEVYDDKFNVVATSPKLDGNRWTAPTPLKRGVVFSWQVKATRGGQEVVSPRPPSPQAKFRILDNGKAREITQARRMYASSHLTMGLLYAQAGLLDEAEQEFRALQKANPDSPLVRKLAESGSDTTTLKSQRLSWQSCRRGRPWPPLRYFCVRREAKKGCPGTATPTIINCHENLYRGLAS